MNDNFDEQDTKKVEEKGKRMKLSPAIAIALIAAIIGGVVSSYFTKDYLYNKILTSLKDEEYIAAQTINIKPDDSISTISAVAKTSISSVVGITTKEIQKFAFTEKEVEGVGSGVIVHSNGYILTNSHVVGDGRVSELTVLFENGDKKLGTVLWNDAALDLAIVKVDATGLPAAKLGDSDNIDIGEIAVAIGNPIGLEFQRTVTSGIISGLHRSIQLQDGTIIEDLIQTDASINPGNSGGPLLNKNGEVIGINTAKITSGEGLGFSIPINQVKPIVEEVIKEGSFKAVFLGISGMDVDLYKKQLGVDLNIEKGVIILDVEENTPANKVGLLRGDIIVNIDDKKIENMSQLKKMLYSYEKGDKAKISIIRNNEEKKLNIEFTDIR